MAKKLSGLDEEVFQAWDKLAFHSGEYDGPPRSREESLEWDRRRLPEWMKLLAMAYEDDECKVSPGIARMVSTSLWYPAMHLEKYAMAEESIERCLRHPGPFDRHDTADLPTRLYATRWIRDRSPEAANALIEHVHCGVYRPGEMARSIYHRLSCWIEPAMPDERAKALPVNDESRALALTLAIALRSGKRHQRASEALQTWREFGLHIALSRGITTES